VSRLLERGVQAFVYTNIDRDGMLGGPDLDEIARVAEVVGTGTFLYSGGIGSLRDVQALAELDLENLVGVVIGKALYEGRFSLAEAMDAVASGPGVRPSRRQSPG
jgi:phosphoribosylformimino-5-aminoimidazole carboxamide ribotide isomerase